MHTSKDNIDFFHQATMRICGNLNLEKALWDSINYLETVIPLTGIALFVIDYTLGTSRTIAQCSRYTDKTILDRIISYRKQALLRLERKWAKLQTQDVMIVNRPESDPVTRTVAQKIKKPNSSLMIMRLKTEQDARLGVLVLYVNGKDRYTSEHAKMLSLLHDPFAIAMSNALKHEEVLNFKDMLADDVRYLHKELLRISGDEIIGEDSGLEGVMEMVRQVSPLNRPALLLGETGAGKEVIASAIHFLSPRKDEPFIKVNCGAIPETLIDSELFGHEKGAFTGAIAQKRGRFERAHKGTILLDEIGDLPLHAQARLLRVLQSKEIERVGGTTSFQVDARVICATHRNLEDMVKKEQFREDLWYRLNLFPITIPPLRQRKEDIPALVKHFIDRKSKELKFHTAPSVAPGALDRLKSYDWPGNVRELENVVEHSLIQNRGQNESSPIQFSSLNLNQNKEKTQFLPETDEYIPTLDELNSTYIQRVLKMTNGKIEGDHGAAGLISIHPSTLRFKMKKLGIQRKPYNIRK